MSNASRINLKQRLQNIFRLIHSGILAISAVALVQFAPSASSIEFPLNVSVYCFAICTPLAAMQAILLTLEIEVQEGVKNPIGYWGHVAFVVGILFSFYTGLIYMSAYFSLWVSGAFAVSSSIGYGLLMYTLVPSARRYLLSVLFSVGFMVFSCAILVIGYAARSQLIALEVI
jgi:hypothetical protein